MTPDERALMHTQERHDAELEAELDEELAEVAEDMWVAEDEGYWWSA